MFDRPVSPAKLTPNEFGFYDALGKLHGSTFTTAPTLVVINGNDVRATFISADDVTTARRAVVEREGAYNASGFADTPNPDTSVPIPGTSGKTTHPSLMSASLVPGNGSAIDYTFDQPVGTVSTDPDLIEGFRAFTSNGSKIQATSATVIGSNTVRATFDSSTTNFYEELVYAATDEDAVTGQNGNGNIVGSAPIGGNVGAFATGFTHGPDARSVTFDNATGTVVIDLDQRVDPAVIDTAQFHLISSDGTDLGNPTSAPTVNQSSTPGDAFVTLQYAPTTLQQGVALQINGTYNPFGTTNSLAAGTVQPHAVQTFGAPGTEGLNGFAPAPNAVQIIAPAAAASAFRAVGSHVHTYVVIHGHKTKKHHSKKHHNKKHHSTKKHH